MCGRIGIGYLMDWLQSVKTTENGPQKRALLYDESYFEPEINFRPELMNQFGLWFHAAAKQPMAISVSRIGYFRTCR